MTTPVAVPEDLAEIPPGPQLAAALARIDPTRVPNHQLLPLLRAQSRQAAHEAARLLGVIAEIARADPTAPDGTVDRLDRPAPYAADEVRAALAWSRRAADRETDLADQVVHQLPAVYAAFLAGRIDRPKVRVFADHLTGLTPTQTERICALLVPLAQRLTPGQLTARLRRLLAAIDPRHDERRYRKALRDRYLTAYLDDTGAAVLTTHGLTPHQAAAALERIDLLAHATRRAGHPATLDQIRVDIVAGLLDGTLHHLTRDQIITHLLAHSSADDGGADDGGADGGADGGDGPEPATVDPPTDDPESDDPAPDDPTPDDPTPDDPAPDPRAGRTDPTAGRVPAHARGHAHQPDPVSPGATRAAGAGADPGSGPAQAPPAEAPDDQRTGIEVRVALSTLLGHDDHPGEIPGLGPIPAAHARAIVARQRRAEWRYAVTDDRGELLHDGITRRRPTGLPPDGPPGGIVELHLPAALLEQLTAAPGAAGSGGWARVLADLAAGFAARGRRDLDAHPDDRLPRAGLRRHIQIRDRTCIGPGCRHRPRRCDQDHTLDHQAGGPTIAADLAPLCRHDHRLKHQGGWTLDQRAPGRFVWTSPLGGRYPVRPEPVTPPLPEPCPRPDDPRHDEPAPGSPASLELWRPERPPPTPPPPPQPVDLDDGPPPF